MEACIIPFKCSVSQMKKKTEWTKSKLTRCQTNLWRHVLLGLHVPISLGRWAERYNRVQKKTSKVMFWEVSLTKYPRNLILCSSKGILFKDINQLKKSSATEVFWKGKFMYAKTIKFMQDSGNFDEKRPEKRANSRS